MRDPFIFTDKENACYYLYGTTDTCDGAANIDPFFEVYVSKDLLNFEGPYAAFTPRKGFWGVKHYWAPEVYGYGGKYYMFASCKGGIGEDRGTCVLEADAPQGPYRDHSHGHVTLRGHECLDGALYLEEGQPYIVFCHEWTELYFGRICALPLHHDLSAAATQEPMVIVDTQTDSLPWIRQMRDDRVDKAGYLTDAPCLYRSGDGTLQMLWSSYAVKGATPGGLGGYVVAVTVSESGTLKGPWRHQQRLLLDADIGHVSLFTDLSGRLVLSGHANDTKHGNEYPVFLPIYEDAGLLTLSNPSIFQRTEVHPYESGAQARTSPS